MKSGTISARRLAVLSMLAASGLVLFVFESFLPLLPWFRPGLGNIATILALFVFGFRDALNVTLLRVVLGALVLGRIFTPVFYFALAGGLASVVVMAGVLRCTGTMFGPVGISILGALAHNLVQLVVAYLLFVKSTEVFIFIPIFMTAGVITGTLTGLVAAMVLERMSMYLSVYQTHGQGVVTMKIGKTRLEVVAHPVTELDVEGIVNPANNMLWFGGGVSAEILRKGGESVESEAVKDAPALIGETIVTGGGKLKAKFVFHAVIAGQDLVVTDDAVRKAMRSCLKKTCEIGCASLAVPMLVLGTHEPEIHKVAGIIIDESIKFLLNEKHSLDYYVFAVKDKGVVDIVTSKLMEKFTRRV